jgi:hypothetical protein
VVHRLSRYSPKYVDGTVVVEECSRDAHADGHQSDSVTQIREIHAVSNARLSCRQAYYACQQGQHGQNACRQHFCLVDRKKRSATGDLGVFAADSPKELLQINDPACQQVHRCGDSNKACQQDMYCE